MLGSDGQPVVGATVRIALNAADSHYSSLGANLVGAGRTDSAGFYRISTVGLSLGSIVDVVVVRKGYSSVLVYGVYNEARIEVDFADLGGNHGDRRMPIGDQVPPFPFEGLLPGGIGT